MWKSFITIRKSPLEKIKYGGKTFSEQHEF